MKFAAIAFTDRGMELGECIKSRLEDDVELTRCGDGMLSDWTKEHFKMAEALVFIGAAGIATRAIAPFVESKITDPAVIVVDELGGFVIPMLSGHIGGGNDIAVRLAKCLGAIPVVTTATDINDIFAVDVWAKRQGLIIANPERIKWISARLLAGETIRLKSLFPIEGRPPEGVVLDDRTYDVLVTYRSRGRADALRLVTPVVTLGIGSKKGVDVDDIETAFQMTLSKAGCHEKAVRAVCSIDRKAGEAGILEFCRRRELPFKTYSAEELQRTNGTFSSSAFVRSVTQVDNVCERSAVLGSDGGRLLSTKNAIKGITMALAIQNPLLSFSEEQ